MTPGRAAGQGTQSSFLAAGGGSGLGVTASPAAGQSVQRVGLRGEGCAPSKPHVL